MDEDRVRQIVREEIARLFPAHTHDPIYDPDYATDWGNYRAVPRSDTFEEYRARLPRARA